MKVIYSGGKYKIFNDGIVTYDELPKGSYQVKFDPQEGFYLERIPKIEIGLSKIFGDNERVVGKILSRYHDFERSMGVALTGFKGSGKTLTAKMLSSQLYELGIPTIVVNDKLPGLFDFLDSIDSEALVLFDEFEKVFSGQSKYGEKTLDPDVLTYLDGVGNNKKLNLIISNQNELSEFLNSRPGRIYYKYSYGSLTKEAITEFMLDKCQIAAKEEVEIAIETLSIYSIAGGLVSYDMLSALAKELNYGETFESSLRFLNVELIMDIPIIIGINSQIFSHRISYDASKGYNSSFIFAETIDLDEDSWGGVRIRVEYNILDFLAKKKLTMDDMKVDILESPQPITNFAIHLKSDW